MANGDGKKCPKGGRPEYRNGDWCAAVNRTPAVSNASRLHGNARAGIRHRYKRVSGRRQGDMMTDETAKEFGWGAHADE
eukprot:795703-Prymnesium_polylepis.1